MDDEVRVSIDCDGDLVTARAKGRQLALELGFSRTDATIIATAISEVGRNIVVHAGRGEVVMRLSSAGHRCGLTVIAIDDGPGMRDVQAALTDGWATRGGLGLGLPGARRLMDEFDIESAPWHGTTVTMRKWRDADEAPLTAPEPRRV